MNRRLVLTATFKKSYQKFVKRHPELQKSIENTLLRMQQDVFDRSLATHKLSGKLFGLRAASCGYDCRIIFSLEKEQLSDAEVIVLLNLGTHEAVY